VSNRAIIGVGLLVCIIIALVIAQFLGLLDWIGVM
jgi:hypothetical protein